MHILSSSEARSKFKSVLDRVIDDHEPVFIHRRDGENAILLSESDYSSMVETLHLLQVPANAERLLRSVALDKKGKAQRRDLIEP